ncbi:Lrp/AsnC family transcriptional regulator [Candidatus Woesearchaeota archaeon]|jgi:DNA-binding Lrp family transcriptional regulator|nr:Lrp/AsnC family transcriptional regulator [Candidatus Woesearchaeota archaeon]
MLIDAINNKILAELDQNSRAQYSTIAKKLKLSKQSIKKRIDKLIDEKIITQFTTIINSAIYPLNPAQIFISLHNTSKDDKEKIVLELFNNFKIPQLTVCDGTYDLFFGLRAENIREFDCELRKICTKYSSHIKDRKIIQLVETKLLPRTFLTGKKREIIPSDKGFHSKINKTQLSPLKEMDYAILNKLAENPKISYVSLANELNITTQTAMNKVKNLEKSNIIIGYSYLLDAHKFVHYQLLLAFTTITKELDQKLNNYFLINPNVIFVSKTLGEFDYTIAFETNNFEDYRKFNEEFKKEFSTHLKSFVPLLVTDFVKLKFL